MMTKLKNRFLVQPWVMWMAVLTFGAAVFAEEEPPVPPTGETEESEPASETPPPAPAEVVAPVAAESPPVKTETVEAAPTGDTATEKAPVGINVDVGLATIYNFRGINVFAESSQMDRNAAFSPSLTWSIVDTGLYLSYWGAYQLSGDNKTEKVDAALGHEQDVILGYALTLAEDMVTLNVAFTYYFYPFADEAVAGAANPSFIEPLAGISVATLLDLGFSVSYFHGVQDEPAITAMRHVYFNLSAGKSFAFNDIFGMSLGMGLGIKAWIEDVDDNRFDLHFDWAAPINLTEMLYVKPAIHLAWTDLDTVSSGDDDDPTTPAVDESTRTARAGDEYMVYATLNVGANF